ncbi:hypothetical protein HMPREF9318_01300 [Streptococcus urinalis FB127-CNA-2]|uniref:ABC transporter, ATP-binding protein n=1 Tax=Streptococcus urinalis 2285-97 TaxID=764291 RepID=G5KCM8_9STRE|nr:ABC transporter, ATP-binding protein [Streptococcus urinalis 2285-97]EKS19778.1 hypothetical protein HMPREF9318_01300 [Streptococcus urinalis FB127-CNA-2]VEF31354.1 Methionine ABC transporter ATP-binding protein [Streptococcus urinalis]
MITFKEIKKSYGQKNALKNLNLTINDGEIFGLIGHNGAGKTTTISILTSIIDPTSGQVFVDDDLLKENRDRIKRKIGYVPDSPDIFLNLTANEYWHFLANLYEVSDEQTESRIKELSELFDIDQEIDNPI